MRVSPALINSLVVYRISTEIWLQEGRVRFLALVMLEIWLRESGVRRLRTFLITSGNLYRIITLPVSRLTIAW